MLLKRAVLILGVLLLPTLSGPAIAANADAAIAPRAVPSAANADAEIAPRAVPSIVCRWCEQIQSVYQDELGRHHYWLEFSEEECNEWDEYCVLCESAFFTFDRTSCHQADNIVLGYWFAPKPDDDCVDMFDPCFQGRVEELSELVSIARSSEINALVDLVANSKSLFFNADREAIQDVGCGDRVLLSLPLTDAQIAAFQKAAAKKIVATAPQVSTADGGGEF